MENESVTVVVVPRCACYVWTGLVASFGYILMSNSLFPSAMQIRASALSFIIYL